MTYSFESETVCETVGDLIDRLSGYSRDLPICGSLEDAVLFTVLIPDDEPSARRLEVEGCDCDVVYRRNRSHRNRRGIG